MWRPVVLFLAGLAGCGLLAPLAWLESEVDADSARQSEREQQLDHPQEPDAGAAPAGAAVRRCG